MNYRDNKWEKGMHIQVIAGRVRVLKQQTCPWCCAHSCNRAVSYASLLVAGLHVTTSQQHRSLMCGTGGYSTRLVTPRRRWKRRRIALRGVVCARMAVLLAA